MERGITYGNEPLPGDHFEGSNQNHKLYMCQPAGPGKPETFKLSELWQWQSIWIQMYVCLSLNILTFESSELEGRKIILKPFILRL